VLKKLLGLSLALGMFFAVIGCTEEKKTPKDKPMEKDAKPKDDTKPKDDKKPKDDTAKPKDDSAKPKDDTKPKETALEFEANKDEVKVAKSGDTEITVKVTKAPAVDVALKAWVDKVDQKVVSGAGTIEKDKTTGKVKLTTKDAPAGVHTVVIETADAKGVKGKTDVKIKVE
jgi:hypothetical protein